MSGGGLGGVGGRPQGNELLGLLVGSARRLRSLSLGWDGSEEGPGPAPGRAPSSPVRTPDPPGPVPSSDPALSHPGEWLSTAGTALGVQNAPT